MQVELSFVTDQENGLTPQTVNPGDVLVKVITLGAQVLDAEAVNVAIGFSIQITCWVVSDPQVPVAIRRTV